MSDAGENNIGHKSNCVGEMVFGFYKVGDFLELRLQDTLILSASLRNFPDIETCKAALTTEFVELIISPESTRLS